MSFYNLLSAQLQSWQHNPWEDEWEFSKFIESTVQTLSPHQAFNALQDSVVILSEEYNDESMHLIIEIFLALARQSNTTQVPTGLIENTKNLRRIALKVPNTTKQKIEGLLNWYRI